MRLEALQEAWEKEWFLTEQERGECGILIATAKVSSYKNGIRDNQSNV